MSGEGNGTGENNRALSIHSAGGGRRPVKVWNATRTIRKALVVSTYDEFQRKGRQKLGLGAVEPIRVVLEADGTQVDDGEYFQTLTENSIFLFLRSGEAWYPAGTDAVRSAVMEAIPPIVCETLYSMGLHDQIPSWKIMDNKGRITVVLHWERGAEGVPVTAAATTTTTTSSAPFSLTHQGSSRKSSTCSTIASGGPRILGVHSRSISQRSGSSVSSTPCLSRDNSRTSSAAAIQHSMLVQTSFDSTKDAKVIEAKGPHHHHHITVINHDGGVKSGGSFLLPTTGARRGSIITGAPSPRQLSRQGSSVESATLAPIHFHTPECSAAGKSLHQPTSHSKRGSPTSNECDFHCCSLHNSASHASHQQQKSVATSPIQQQQQQSGESGTSSDGKRSLPKGAHVRFSNVDGDLRTSQTPQHSGTTTLTTTTTTSSNKATTTASTTGASTTTSSSSNGPPTVIATAVTALGSSSSIQCHAIFETTSAGTTRSGNESSESETENNEDAETSVKFLLLVDQLSVEQNAHLSVKDIGIILERLNSKIIDVEKLDREIEGSDTHNWTIKATIRGEVLRELGVIYNNNYYSISEHPGYQSSSGDDDEEDDDDDDDEIEEEDEEPSEEDQSLNNNKKQ